MKKFWGSGVRRQELEVSPDFSPRFWKGGASAPPLKGRLDYFHVPRPSVAAATSRKLRGARNEQSVGAPISARLEAYPSKAEARKAG